MSAFRNAFEALGKPVLYEQLPTTEGKEGTDFHLYYASKGDRSKGAIGLDNLFPNETFTMRHTPHVINNHAYYTLYISRELGERLISAGYPESHVIYANMDRGGCRTFETELGKSSTEKLEEALGTGQGRSPSAA